MTTTDARRLRHALDLVVQAMDELDACEPTLVLENVRGRLAAAGLLLLAWRTSDDEIGTCDPKEQSS